jgi:hypothetical protein
LPKTFRGTNANIFFYKNSPNFSHINVKFGQFKKSQKITGQFFSEKIAQFRPIGEKSPNLITLSIDFGVFYRVCHF